MKPKGIPKNNVNIPKAKHISKAFDSFFPLYPPYLSEIVPPNKTPLNGAVILIIEKIIFTTIGSSFNISIKYFVIQN